MTAEELFKQVPFHLTDEEVRGLDADGLLGEDYFVYKCDTEYDWLQDENFNGVSVYCPSCCDTVMYEKAKRGCSKGGGSHIGFLVDGASYFSGDGYICPRCGHIGKAYHVSSISRYGSEIDYEFVCKVLRVSDLPVLAYYYVWKECLPDGRILLRSKGNYAYALLDGKMCYAKGFCRFYYSYRNYGAWQTLKTAKYPVFRVGRIMPFEKDLFDGTEFENLHLDRYIEDSGLQKASMSHVYLALWNKHRNVENFVTSGLTGVLNSLIDAHTIKHYNPGINYHTLLLSEIRWKKKRPCEMLGLDKKGLEFLLDFEDWNYRRYCFYSFFWSKGIRLEPHELRRFQVGNWCIDHLKKIFGYGIDPRKCFAYFEKQRERDRRRPVNLIDLLDYYGAIEKCGEAVTKDRWFPKDFWKAHDRQVDRVKQVRDAILDEKIFKQGERLKALSFIDEAAGLMIRPCVGYLELVKEGKELHHCVATYAEKVASGESEIFFIRKLEEPEKPFYTLELILRSKTIAQNRGLRNCGRTKDVAAFEGDWLNYVKGVKIS